MNENVKLIMEFEIIKPSSFFVQEYDQGNNENTVYLLKYLIAAINPDSRLLIIWDGAS